MRFARFVAAALLLGALGAGAGRALAGGAEEHRVAGRDDFAAGTLEGLSLDEDGVLRLGATTTPVDLDVPTTWAAVRTGDTVWVGTGNEGKVVQVRADATGAIDTGKDALMVTALAPLPQGAVAAALYPGGHIVRVGQDGALKDIAKLPVEYVWAMHADKRGALLAACGAPGTLYTVDPFGAIERLADVHDEHARCMVVAADRTLVGTAPKGLVLEWKDKALRVLHDLEPQEVIGIAVREDGSMLVAANEDDVGGNAQQIKGLLDKISRPRETNANQKPAERSSLQNGRLLHLRADGGTEVLWQEKNRSLLCLQTVGDRVFVGSHPDGRILRLEPDLTTVVHADLPQSEVSVLLAGTAVAPSAVTSNPGVLHVPGAEAGTGTWTSAPMDPGGRARWGSLQVWGRGVHAVHIRSGETDEPDATWTSWAPSAGFEGQRGATGIVARYLQVRVTLQGADAQLRALEVVRRTPNNAPAISDLALEARKVDTKTGLVDASPVRTLKWTVEDDDQDRVRTTLRARRDGSSRWTRLIDNEVLEKTEFTWDTTGWPDGRYRVELTVTDTPDNPLDRAQEATEALPSVTIDNTPPRVVLTVRPGDGDQLAIDGEADDGAAGRVRWARVSVDGGDWVQLAARDGLFDTSKEAFRATIPHVEAGEHDVIVQVADTEGNIGSAIATVTTK